MWLSPCQDYNNEQKGGKGEEEAVRQIRYRQQWRQCQRRWGLYHSDGTISASRWRWYSLIISRCSQTSLYNPKTMIHPRQKIFFLPGTQSNLHHICIEIYKTAQVPVLYLHRPDRSNILTAYQELEVVEGSDDMTTMSLHYIFYCNTWKQNKQPVWLISLCAQ